MSLEFRTERPTSGKSKKCTGVYFDKKRVGEVINYGSMAVFRTDSGSRTFPNDMAAKQYVETAYTASHQGPPDPRPTASATPPAQPQRLSQPAPTDDRKRLPDNPDDTERLLFDIMRDIGEVEVTPPDTDLPLMTLDDVLWSGVNHILGNDPHNGGTVLQAKRMVVNTIIRRMGHYLPADFDRTARHNPLLRYNAAAAAERFRTAPTAIARELVKKKPDLVESAPEPEPAATAASPQPDYDYPDSLFDISDMFEVHERRLEQQMLPESPETLPESPQNLPESPPKPDLEPAHYVEAAVLATSPVIEYPPVKTLPDRPAGARIAKFNSAETKQIRAKYWQGVPADELVREYGTSIPTIHRIAEGTYSPRLKA